MWMGQERKEVHVLETSWEVQLPGPAYGVGRGEESVDTWRLYLSHGADVGSCADRGLCGGEQGNCAGVEAHRSFI